MNQTTVNTNAEQKKKKWNVFQYCCKERNERLYSDCELIMSEKTIDRQTEIYLFWIIIFFSFYDILYCQNT